MHSRPAECIEIAQSRVTTNPSCPSLISAMTTYPQLKTVFVTGSRYHTLSIVSTLVISFHLLPSINQSARSTYSTCFYVDKAVNQNNISSRRTQSRSFCVLLEIQMPILRFISLSSSAFVDTLPWLCLKKEPLELIYLWRQRHVNFHVSYQNNLLSIPYLLY
jgi:hypothetical protein